MSCGICRKYPAVVSSAMLKTISDAIEESKKAHYFAIIIG